METAALLVVLAIVGGFVVVRAVFLEDIRAGKGAAERSADGRRRRLLTATALTDALAIVGEEELRPSFFGRTRAFGRLLLVILFICALAGGALFWMAMMIATKAHIHPS